MFGVGTADEDPERSSLDLHWASIFLMQRVKPLRGIAALFLPQILSSDAISFSTRHVLSLGERPVTYPL